MCHQWLQSNSFLYLILTKLGNNVATAIPALERLGAQGPFDPGYHGSYAFSGCTGTAPRFYTKAEVRPRYHGPAIVAQLIPTPAAQKGLCVSSWISSTSNASRRVLPYFEATRSTVEYRTWETSSVSLRYPNTEKRVENTLHSGVLFLRKSRC